MRGEYRDGHARYMMIRADALMGIVREAAPEQRPAVLEAMARAVTRAGGDSARMYQRMGANEAAALARTIEATAPVLGWGTWRMEVRGDGMELVVHNSPFAAGYGPAEMPVCHPIVGMLRAAGPMILGRPAEAREVCCAAMGAESCRFVVG